MEQAQSLFESWAKTQREMIDAWSETAEKVQRSLAGIMNTEVGERGTAESPDNVRVVAEHHDGGFR
ncbi:MAG: hypothetical protein MZV70_34925 [Desulfobacterales bacterium]|nr:hypothetical protein [Desulfobacterales bacterium]